MSRRTLVLVLAVLAQLGLVGVATAGELSARLTGDEYLVRVQPVDPIDPFRGAYVALTYPDLQRNDSEGADGGLGSMEDGESGEVYVSVAEEDGYLVATSHSRSRPFDGLYLACDDRDWQIRCGIESWFLPQDEAAAMERAVAGGEVTARVRIDGRGNAALVGVETE